MVQTICRIAAPMFAVNVVQPWNSEETPPVQTNSVDGLPANVGIGIVPLFCLSSLVHTMRAETNSNVFGVFWNLAESNLNFVVAKIIFFERFEFLVCSKFSDTHHVAVNVHVLWPVCTHTIPIRMLWCP